MNKKYQTGKPRSKNTKSSYVRNARQSKLTREQYDNLVGQVVPISLQIEVEKYGARNQRVIR